MSAGPRASIGENGGPRAHGGPGPRGGPRAHDGPGPLGDSRTNGGGGGGGGGGASDVRRPSGARRHDDALSGALLRRLRSLGRRVDPAEIGELWIFPPLEGLEHSAEFFLFTALLGEERRRLCTARLELPPGGGDGENGGMAPRDAPGHGAAARNGGGANGTGGNGAGANGAGPHGEVEQEIFEHGVVPKGRVPGFVERFRRRTGASESLHLVVEGSRERWRTLVGEEEDAEERRNGGPPA